MKINFKGFNGITVLMAFAWLAVIISLFELPARTEYARTHLPEKGLGTSSRQFEIQYARLEDREKQEGRIDCIFVGNSHILRAIDPSVIEKIYAEKFGKQIVCQNFGLRGTSVKLNSDMAVILAKRYHPKLMIMGLSMVDMDASLAGKGDRSIRQSPWIQYQSGEFVPEGYIIDWLYSYRYYLALNSLMFNKVQVVDADGASFETNIQDDGFNPSSNVYGIKKIDPIYAEQMRSTYEKIKIDPISIQAVEQFWELTRSGTQIMIIESPITMSSLNLSPHVMDVHTQFIDRMEAASQKYDGHFLVTYNLSIVPDNGWSDHNHLNWLGAQAFSRWVGEQIVTKLQDGIIFFE